LFLDLISSGPSKSEVADWINVLVAGGLEIYGTLRTKAQTNAVTESFHRYQKDMDTNGIIHGLEGDVSCYSSPIDVGYARDLVSREESYLITTSIDNPW
jgi:hypothetical protein